jgi:hypothetical protein
MAWRADFFGYKPPKRWLNLRTNLAYFGLNQLKLADSIFDHNSSFSLINHLFTPKYTPEFFSPAAAFHLLAQITL